MLDVPYELVEHVSWLLYARRRELNVQVITRRAGTPLWFSRATPGRSHDLTAARAHGIVQACLTRQILVLADGAYQGRRRDRAHPVLRTSRTAFAPPAVQPRPRPPTGTPRTRLRPPQVLAPAATSPCSTNRIGCVIHAIYMLLTCEYTGLKELSD